MRVLSVLNMSTAQTRPSLTQFGLGRLFIYFQAKSLCPVSSKENEIQVRALATSARGECGQLPARLYSVKFNTDPKGEVSSVV